MPIRTFAPPAPSDLPPRLRVQGRDLLKPNGAPIVLRGVNFGTWGEDLVVDLNDLQAWGANCVRVPLRWWGRYGDPAIDARDDNAVGFVRREHLAHWLGLIFNAAARGVWVIPTIDSNCGQSGTQPDAPAYCDPYGMFGSAGRNFFTDAPMRKLAIIVWQAIARLLRSFSHIAMLELLPEALDGRDARWASAVADFYRELIAAVREVDADTPFLIGARNAYDVTLCDEAWLEERRDVVYTGNLLSAKVTNASKLAQGIAALAAMREKRNVPVFVQQLGRKTGDDRDLSHMASALQQLTDARIGYAWWQNRQNMANADEYALRFKDGRGGWIEKTDEINLLSQFLDAKPAAA